MQAFWCGFEKRAAMSGEKPLSAIAKRIKRLHIEKDKNRIFQEAGKTKNWLSSVKRDY